MSNKLTVFIAAIPFLVVLYFFENIRGYYRFKWYCQNEGGLKVYEKLDKNVGWMADSKSTAKVAAQLDYVDFVRYPDKKDKKVFYDLNYIGGNPSDKKSYEINSADMSKKILYLWSKDSGYVIDELRLEKTSYQLIKNNSKDRVLLFNIFGYSKFDRNKTLLHAPSGVSCYTPNAMLEAIDLTGNQKFVDEIEERIGIRVEKRGRGSPRKSVK